MGDLHSSVRILGSQPASLSFQIDPDASFTFSYTYQDWNNDDATCLGEG